MKCRAIGDCVLEVFEVTALLRFGISESGEALIGPAGQLRIHESLSHDYVRQFMRERRSQKIRLPSNEIDSAAINVVFFNADQR